MRILVPIAAAAVLAGCATRVPEAPGPVQPAAPAPTMREIHTNLSGATTGELIQLLGQPAFQVREGPGLKLQFRGRSCILDAFLYPPQQGTGPERVTYIDARTFSGGSTDKEECVLSMVRR
jgi:hypothetical protein